MEDRLQYSYNFETLTIGTSKHIGNFKVNVFQHEGHLSLSAFSRISQYHHKEMVWFQHIQLLLHSWFSQAKYFDHVLPWL